MAIKEDMQLQESRTTYDSMTLRKNIYIGNASMGAHFLSIKFLSLLQSSDKFGDF